MYFWGLLDSPFEENPNCHSQCPLSGGRSHISCHLSSTVAVRGTSSEGKRKSQEDMETRKKLASLVDCKDREEKYLFSVLAKTDILKVTSILL